MTRPSSCTTTVFLPFRFDAKTCVIPCAESRAGICETSRCSVTSLHVCDR
jgi:hypothetical protein